MKQTLDGVGTRIMIMRSKGYRQEEIAKILGISQSAVSQRLKSIRRIHNIPDEV